MEIFIIIFFLVLGALIGSFLNVVILRLNTGRNLEGRSSCASCSLTLRWYELIPIFSFLLQNGKCLRCKSVVSKQYIFIETITALLFAGISYRILFPMYDIYDVVTIINLLIALSASSLLIVIFMYDLRHKIIPDGLSYGFAIFALMRLFLFYQDQIFSFEGVLNLLAGPIAALPFYILWKVSSGRWIGLGDAKLAIGIGWFLGLGGAISALAISFWVGAIISLLVVFYGYKKNKRNRLRMKSEIPFAPFMIVGFFIVYFFPVDIFYISTIIELLRL